MRLKLVPARQGVVWVRQGLAVFLRRPLGFALLFLIYMLVGPIVMFAVAPLATIGFMIATQRTLAGRYPFANVFLEPLRASRAQRWSQVQLGLAYAAGMAVVFWLGDVVGGAAFDALSTAVSAGHTTPDELQTLLADPALQAGWLVLAGGAALLAVPFWHAPALVHWGGLRAPKALFFSTVACWRNKWALSVFSAGWALVVVLFTLASTTVFSLLGVPQLALAAVTPGMLMLSAGFYASLYFTYADSFDPPSPPLPENRS